MKEKVLALLRECDTYVSKQDICTQLGISQMAVLEYIHMLQKEGYRIESVKKKGYRFIEAPDCLTEQEIVSQLKTEVFAKNTIYYEEIDSTNEEAKRLAEDGIAHGTLVISDYQSRGKGRMGRTWISPRGTSAYMSILLRPQMESQYASGLTLVAALAVCDAMERLGCQAKIKWPNDVIINGKKVCGILTEMSSEMDEIHYVVIGIGININGDSFPEEILDMATSMKKECGQKKNRAKLVVYVMEELERDYDIYCQTNDLTHLLDRYHAKLVNKNEKVRLLQQGEEQIRTAVGIDERGALLVSNEEGEIEKIVSGEVSVRGVYGYV